MVGPANSINETTTGITGFTSTSFVGTPVTQYNVITGGSTSSTLNNVAPSATSGVPLISQGSSSQPAFGTAVVAGGGTGATTLTGLLTGNGTSAITATAITQYNVLTAGASNAPNNVAPSATSGVPLISQGSSSQPVFGTAVVAGGGTGDTSFTAYAVICGGTSSTAALQSIAGVGSSGQVLTSNGAGALPTFQAAASTGAVVLLHTLTASSSASLSFTSTYITSTYNVYKVIFNQVLPATGGGVQWLMDWSTDNGSTFLGSNYATGNQYNSYSSASWTNANSSTTCVLTGTTQVSTPYGLCGEITICGLAASTATGPNYFGQLYLANINVLSYGFNTGSSTVNNIRFKFSSGNIASGTISLYGVTQ
jgi:hypothetical protein